MFTIERLLNLPSSSNSKRSKADEKFVDLTIGDKEEEERRHKERYISSCDSAAESDKESTTSDGNADCMHYTLLQ